MKNTRNYFLQFSFLFFLMIFGVSHVSNNFGVPWFVLFVDDCTQTKSEVNLIFLIFHKMEANQFNRKIRILRSYDD